MEMKTIVVKIKDPQRFLWGVREFYPNTRVTLLKQEDLWHEYKLVYNLTGTRDGVAGYCKGYRNW
jgi:hypothetical protein